ncbi:MAG: pilus assembly protein [Proteobacteria bacterium]|nr:pilus assembly protein [Pseudomonadota bacterium]
MAKRRIPSFLTDQRGAVAVTYALALTGLVVIAGVGFDYGRLVAMDSELQAAADQAALAGATQLNGASDSMTRAVTQASNLVSNSTLQANDNLGRTVTISDVKFYQTRADAEADSNSFTAADTTRYNDAHFIRVKTTARKAYYAFTPIVAAFSSQNITAAATAGLGSAICRKPPLFVCKPTGTISDPAAWIESHKGDGILLKAKGSSWAPGNFGYLDTNIGNGAKALSQMFAYANPPGDCVSADAPQTDPGQKQSVVPDFNTRFDIYENGDNIDCYSSDSLCPPAENSRKDIVQPTTTAPSKLKDCNSPSKGWVFSNRPYRPLTAAVMTGSTAANFPDAMGLPRDLCHAVPSASASCAEDFLGNGSWDINAYWWANYGTAYPNNIPTAVAGRTYPTRYEIYNWEKTNAPAYRDIPSTTMRNYKAPICRSAPTAGTPDRRVIPVAILDCTTLGGGKQTVTPLDWMDVFLTEPSLDRSDSSGRSFTSAGDFYGEVIGRTGQGTGGAANQTVRRDKPYLVN